MAEIFTKPVDPYHATGTQIVVVILRIVLIRVHLLIVPIGVLSVRRPLVTKFIRFEMQSQPHLFFQPKRGLDFAQPKGLKTFNERSFQVSFFMQNFFVKEHFTVACSEASDYSPSCFILQRTDEKERPPQGGLLKIKFKEN